jgi:hypothetical protein
MGVNPRFFKFTALVLIYIFVLVGVAVLSANRDCWLRESSMPTFPEYVESTLVNTNTEMNHVTRGLIEHRYTTLSTANVLQDFYISQDCSVFGPGEIAWTCEGEATPFGSYSVHMPTAQRQVNIIEYSITTSWQKCGGEVWFED